MQRQIIFLMFSISGLEGLKLFWLVVAILGSLSGGICFAYCSVLLLFTVILLIAIPETAEYFYVVSL